MSPARHDEPVMSNEDAKTLSEYVTAAIGAQLFGLPILRVQDVFLPERLTKVPLAPPEIAGVLNLRGRIITLIDMRCVLGLEMHVGEEPVMAIGVEARGESYGLLVDGVGEVLKLDEESHEPNPINLDPRLARVSAGIHRLDGQLLIVVDVERVLDGGGKAIAA